jgi:hypothetical protein
MNGTGDRITRLSKWRILDWAVSVWGNPNPRNQSKAAPDESFVMREYRPANIRLIIVAVAEFGFLFCSLAMNKKQDG